MPSISGVESGPNLLQAAELPSLFGDMGGGGGSGSGGSGGSGASAGGHTPRGGSSNVVLAPPLISTTASNPIRSGSSWLWGVAGAVVLLASGVFALRQRHPPVSAPPAPVTVPAPTPPPVATTTPVHLETSPPGALVEWNGRPLARTPTDFQLPPGAQMLRVSLEGYEPEDVVLDVALREPIARAVVLRAKPAPAPAPIATAPAGGHHRTVAPQPTPGVAKPAPTASAPRLEDPRRRRLHRSFRFRREFR